MTHSPPAERCLTVALVGNPNTGKSTLFNALTGLHQKVGNYPGVTVEKKLGTAYVENVKLTIIDLPGTYSLAARSNDEQVTLDVLMGNVKETPKPDLILNIVDASNLERNLFLTTQLVELGIPVMVAVNMIDVAKAQGYSFEEQELTKVWGLPFICIQANKKRGLEALSQCLIRHAGLPKRVTVFPTSFDNEQNLLIEQGIIPDSREPAANRFLAQRLIIDVGGTIEERYASSETAKRMLLEIRNRLATQQCAVPQIEAKTRWAFIREQIRPLIRKDPTKTGSTSAKIDRIVTHKIWGTLIFLAVMFLIFQSIFTWAKPFMEAIDSGKSWFGDLVSSHLSAGPFRSLLVDGVISGVGSVLVFLPQIAILFAFLAVLEDCGYMARAAFMMDKLMSRCGLSGKSFIPLLSSFACAIPGIMATRVIEDRRERLATILVAPLMSCSARLPIYALLIGAFIPTNTWLGSLLPGIVLFAIYLLGVIVAPFIVWLLKARLLKGEKSVFVMELPMYRWPTLKSVFYRIWERCMAFLVRAGTFILASMIIVWLLLYFPAKDAAGNSFETRVEQLEENISDIQKQLDAKTEPALQEELQKKKESLESELNQVRGTWKRNSLLGRFGKAIEPVFLPLGWDWRIGTAAMAAFPAREVLVGTLGLIFGEGEVDTKETTAIGELGKKLEDATWERPGARGESRKLFTLPVALSLIVFFALCCQCVSTLVIIKRETNSWRWPIFTFVYMTLLAYVGAFITYRIALLWSV